jgi:hypothetical protein
MHRSIFITVLAGFTASVVAAPADAAAAVDPAVLTQFYIGTDCLARVPALSRASGVCYSLPGLPGQGFLKIEQFFGSCHTGKPSF